MTDALQTPLRRSKFTPWLLPASVFLLLTIATLILWQWQTQVQREADEFSDSQESAAITTEIRDRLRLNAQFLSSLQAFATANPGQTLQSWRRYAEKIDISASPSGLFAFAYAPVIQTSQVENFIFSTRPQVDRSNFQIFPKSSGASVAPLVFIATQQATPHPAIGFDLLSEPTRRQAIQMATDTRDIALSGQVELIGDQASQGPAFMMVHALYGPGLPLANVLQRRQAFSGIVLTAFYTDAFFSLLKHGDKRRLALQIFDENLSSDSTPNQPTLIYDSAPNFVAMPDNRLLHHEIDFGGRNWILKFRPNNHSNQAEGLDLPKVILFGGMLVSSLVALLICYLSTHRQRAERYAHKVTQELRQHRDHLHELVAERTARLDAALKRVLASNQAKTEFLANMSHELRTPMHAVLSFAQLGVERADSIEQPKLNQYFQRIEQSATRLLGLINELLDLSKLDSGRMGLLLTQTDMQLLIRQSIEQVESLLITHQLQIELHALSTDCMVPVDTKRMAQVIFNLLSNAIKFSPRQSIIRIELDASELPFGRRADDDGRQPALTIRFIDTGIGIPEEELESIFDKFEQSSATRNGAGGTGLGLAISRAIVTQHRGTIVAENNIGGGACFTLTLPKNNQTEDA